MNLGRRSDGIGVSIVEILIVQGGR